jgi:hypothetical protein
MVHARSIARAAGEEPASEQGEAGSEAQTSVVMRAAVAADAASDGCFEVLPRGSYKNNMNVRPDSDVDVAVASHQVFHPEYARLSAADQQRVAGGSPATWLHPAE